VIRFASAQETFALPLIGAVRSWQVVFLIVGLPGLLVALLLLTIREPVRQGVAVKRAVPLAEVWAYLRGNQGTFTCLYLGIALAALNGYGAAAWIPEFFIRRHGWTPGDTGMIVGLIVGLAGTTGIVTGGRLADWLRQRDQSDANLRVSLLGVVLWLPFGVLASVVPSGVWAAALLAPAFFFSSMPFGLAPAAIQQLMPNTMRAQASAIYLFVINLIGLGLGPTLVAVLTEDVFRDKGDLHLSLMVVGISTHVSAALLLWKGLAHYRRSLEYLHQWSQAGN
jgi:hypothetical protein